MGETELIDSILDKVWKKVGISHVELPADLATECGHRPLNACSSATSMYLEYLQSGAFYPKASGTVIESNKTTLSVHQFMEESDETYCVESKAFTISASACPE